MISVYLRPDATQVVRAKVKKGILNVQESKTIEKSFLPDMQANGAFPEDAPDLFEEMFKAVLGTVKAKKEEFYIVLPDYLFLMEDCFRFDSDSDIRFHIESGVHKSIGDVCYAQPIITAPEPQQRLATICVLSHEVADAIYEGAKRCHIQLSSVESAGISFLRGTGFFMKEELSLYSFAGHASFIGYSSNGGLFKMDTPELSVSYLSSLDEIEAEQTIRQYMIEFENAAHQTFEFLNQDLPYTLMMPQDVIDKYPALLERKAEDHELPSFIHGTDYENNDEWLCVLGTLLQSIDFNDDKYADILDSYESIESGNVLPDEIKQSSKRYQRFEDLTKYTKFGVFALLFACIAEGAAIGVLSNIEIPKDLQEEYNNAQANTQRVTTELAVIHSAEGEHEYPLDAYEAITSRIPDGVKLTSFDVGNPTKQDNSRWVKAKIFADDPLKFQDFVKSLSDAKEFQSVSIPQFNTDSGTGYKTAEMTISKGKVGK